MKVGLKNDLRDVAKAGVEVVDLLGGREIEDVADDKHPGVVLGVDLVFLIFGLRLCGGEGGRYLLDVLFLQKLKEQLRAVEPGLFGPGDLDHPVVEKLIPIDKLNGGAAGLGPLKLDEGLQDLLVRKNENVFYLPKRNEELVQGLHVLHFAPCPEIGVAHVHD